MAEQAYAYVTLIPVAEGFQRKIAQQLKGVGGAGGDAGKITGQNFSEGFGASIKRVGLLAAGALATAGVGRLLGDSIKQASDLGESINAVNVAFGDAASGVLKLGETSARAMGLSTNEFNNAAVRFSAFAERVVGEGGNVAGFIGDISQRATDFASVFNIDVSEALQVFQSGLAGEAEPLKRFGINLLQSEVAAYAMANGIAESASQMTEAQKVQARYGLLLEQTAKTQGDFANTSDGLANQQRIVKAEFTNLQAELGSALVPTMERLLGVVADQVLPAFEEFGDWLGSPDGRKAVEDFTEAAVFLVETTINITKAVFEQLPLLTALGIAFAATTVKTNLLTIAKTKATVAQLALNAAMAANPIGLLLTALALAVVGVTAFANANEAATPTQDELKQSIADTTKELEFYREEQGKTENTKLYEGRIRELEDALRDQRAALQESYNWTQAQSDASYRARDAAIANRIASQNLKPALDNTGGAYYNLATAATNARLGIESVTIAEEAQRQLNYALTLGIGDQQSAMELYEKILARVTAKVKYQTVEQVEFNESVEEAGRALGLVVDGADSASKSTSGYTTATQGATVATDAYTTALGQNSATLESAIPVNQEFLDVINGVASVELAPSIADATREIQGMIIELDKANELTRLEGGFVEFMQGGATVRAKFDPVTGELLESYTDAGSTPARTVTGDIIDINAFTNAINDGTDYIQGLTDFAGGTQGFLNAVLGQVTLTDPDTGMSRTLSASDPESLQMAIERAEKEGYVNGGGFEGDVNGLVDTLKDIDTKLGTAIIADVALASGGLVTRPTTALIGEAGPEVVIPLDRFESMMGMGTSAGKTLVYNAAPNQSMDTEEELFTAMRRAKVVANW